MTPNSPAISADKGAENMELDKGTSGSPSRTVTSLDLQSNFVSVPMSDDEMRIRDQAATKAQAVFRGFLVIVSGTACNVATYVTIVFCRPKLGA